MLQENKLELAIEELNKARELLHLTDEWKTFESCLKKVNSIEKEIEYSFYSVMQNETYVNHTH